MAARLPPRNRPPGRGSSGMVNAASQADFDAIIQTEQSFIEEVRMDSVSITLTAQNENFGDTFIDKCIALVQASYYNELNFLALNTNAGATSGPLLLQWWNVAGAVWTNITGASLVVNTTPALPNISGWIPLPGAMVTQGDTFIRAHKAVLDALTDIPMIQVTFRKKIKFLRNQ